MLRACQRVGGAEAACRHAGVAGGGGEGAAGPNNTSSAENWIAVRCVWGAAPGARQLSLCAKRPSCSNPAETVGDLLRVAGLRYETSAFAASYSSRC